ncbi:MAG: glycosyltransferase family 39 protein [Candidatus Bathyarchaeota archaeon]|nr:glycosyltransferase family 39 protein [Candidatus Bathyarchaeota archaeon]
MRNKSKIINLINGKVPLLSVLIGTALILVAIGPFENGDTEWEFQATSGVLRWGMPYVKDIGNMMDQPPLGFYTAALFLKAFGASADTGVILVTLFGLGSIIVLYKLGKTFYGENTGLFAAALFALTPWYLILSRSFLIDTQCLFLSLLCFFVGILAVRKESGKLAVGAGVLFAAALLTKLYAVFILIPLAMFYFFFRKKLKRSLNLVVGFCLPSLVFVLLWYEVISGQGVLSVFNHGDFSNPNYANVVPSYFFVINFLGDYGLGWFLLAASTLSLGIGIIGRKHFAKTFTFDLIYIAIIVLVVSVNTFLGATLNLKSPYNNAIKFDYQLLPFFSLAAASLAGKCLTIFNYAKTKTTFKKWFLFTVGLAGIFLLSAAFFVNIQAAQQLSRSDYLIFKVERNVDVGYSLFNFDLAANSNQTQSIQYIGFTLILFGCLWQLRQKIWDAFQPMRRWIKTKDALLTENKKRSIKNEKRE